MKKIMMSVLACGLMVAGYSQVTPATQAGLINKTDEQKKSELVHHIEKEMPRKKVVRPSMYKEVLENPNRKDVLEIVQKDKNLQDYLKKNPSLLRSFGLTEKDLK